MASCATDPRRAALTLARVLLVDNDPASRLALQTVLQAGGYSVDAAAAAAEAIGKLEDNEYELVLSEAVLESPEAGLRLLAHARNLRYRPATAVITTYPVEVEPGSALRDEPLLIAWEDLPELLTRIAELISKRAARRAARALRNPSR